MQGLCIRAQAEHYRRMISEEGVFTRGTLYWQLVGKKNYNDTSSSIQLLLIPILQPYTSSLSLASLTFLLTTALPNTSFPTFQLPSLTYLLPSLPLSNFPNVLFPLTPARLKHLSLSLLQNDIWQAQTWSSVEWTGQWKILHYYMRRVYAPILVSAYQEDDRLLVYVVLDVIDHEISYTLDVSAISWADVSTC